VLVGRPTHREDPESVTDVAQGIPEIVPHAGSPGITHETNMKSTRAIVQRVHSAAL